VVPPAEPTPPAPSFQSDITPATPAPAFEAPSQPPVEKVVDLRAEDAWSARLRPGRSDAVEHAGPGSGTAAAAGALEDRPSRAGAPASSWTR